MPANTAQQPCPVCGAVVQVLHNGRLIRHFDLRAKPVWCQGAGGAAGGCASFQPDHNGECVNCDEWIDAHSAAAIAAGKGKPTTI